MEKRGRSVMSIFSETMKKSISIYRQMLRKYLPQAERTKKLNQLKLKDRHLYNSEVELYRLGHTIVTDIKENLDNTNVSYYSYSGVRNFANHLENFLENYEIENSDRVIHRSQKVARALVEAIQLLTVPRNQLTEEIKEKLVSCTALIASFGSEEQRELYKTMFQNTIHKQQEQNAAFYRLILHNFQKEMQEVSR
ncbi:hypothetical protein [Coxiella burnetii]|uniref:hypothetical protein n=1 Tax=Coxiella burnetii TaxID=777 RepID=UPI000183D1CA|nr:hypothetical protein [Coxiella burnetii]ACJ21101.1 hypothetical protein CbuK_1996 [Coxiella burnetii CbuK_Q154]EAX32124.3 hypothetical protein A35_10150 [Coxiella burnetii 'MSU Goat Q177']UYK69796.1 hypothetical protein OHM78_00275 [Coxiella burnetii]